MTEPLHWRDRLRAGLPLLPVAGGTNVTWGYVVSDAGALQTYAQITVGTPTKEGIDMHSGGYGSQLRPYQWLSVFRLADGFAYQLKRTGTIYEEQAFPAFVLSDGDFGTRKLVDDTLVPQLFAPWDWQDPFENIASDTPLAPPLDERYQTRYARGVVGYH